MQKRLRFIPISIVVALVLISVGGSAIAAPLVQSSKAGPARAATRSAAEFYAPRGLGMECGMYLNGVHCQSMRTRPYFAQVAELQPGGTVTRCSTRRLTPNTCDLGNAGEHTPTLSYGKRVTVGPFRCQILSAGVKCTMTSTGKGFLMSRTKMLAVGGASIRPAPLHLEGFLSPDRKVWCITGTATDAFGISCGTEPKPPTRAASLDRNGTVAICFVPTLILPSSGHGPPAGCFQNWDSNAPILKYGQQTELNGLRCISATDGITCTVLTGAGQGKGFRVNKDEAVELS